MKIQIKGQDIELKPSFRAYIIFENITGKSFQSVSTLSDIVCFFYASVLAVTKNANISFDEFMDFVDSDPLIVTQFAEWITKTNDVISEASNPTIEKEDTKKKTIRRKS